MSPTAHPYVAILLSRSSSDAPNYQALWEETTVLIHADDTASAHRAATARGRAAETQFRTDRGDLVQWSFVRVVDVARALDEDLSRDADLRTRTFRDEDAYARLFEGE